uniref:Uncharacterized protein n=1 Tax=Arundo donax TaxID=35708 RepID=A0A0A9DHQ5_ARUDO
MQAFVHLSIFISNTKLSLKPFSEFVIGRGCCFWTRPSFADCYLSMLEFVSRFITCPSPIACDSPSFDAVASRH